MNLVKIRLSCFGMFLHAVMHEPVCQKKMFQSFCGGAFSFAFSLHRYERLMHVHVIHTKLPFTSKLVGLKQPSSDEFWRVHEFRISTF